MARKKRATEKKLTEKSFFRKIQWRESYISLFLGVAVVIIAIILIFVFSKNVKQGIKTSTPEISSQKTQQIADSNSTTYTVLQGEDLWTISEKKYKTGYKWVDIARANNLKNPDIIEIDQKLKLPKIELKDNGLAKEIAVSPTIIQSNSQKPAISGKTYTVRSGDYLWDIAVRAYGDGFRWVDIARANNVSGPDYIIFKDDILKLPDNPLK